MQQYDKVMARHTWATLNLALMELEHPGIVKAMLAAERRGKRRKVFIRRLEGRLRVLNRLVRR